MVLDIGSLQELAWNVGYTRQKAAIPLYLFNLMLIFFAQCHYAVICQWRTFAPVLRYH